MIIFNGEKYSCVSCIRGHRSSTCKHSERMLVKVRTRGRPAPVDVRKVILVDNDSRVSQKMNDDCKCPVEKNSGCGCSSAERQPILFLRAIATKKALLVDGSLKIMVTSESSTPNSDFKESSKEVPGEPCTFVSEDEFLLKHSTNGRISCCSSHENIEREDNNDHSNQETKFNDNPLRGFDSYEPKNGEMRLPDDSMVELFTHKGAYLSSACVCDENCPCSNCLIHRKEEELENYIQELNQPLVPLGNAHLMQSSRQNPYIRNQFSDHTIQNSLENHNTKDIYNANTAGHIKANDIVTMSELLVRGMLNYEWRKTMVIHHKAKLIPSRYWWDFITAQIPIMTKKQLRYLDLLEWFDNLVSTYSSELPNFNDDTHEETFYFPRNEFSTKPINNSPQQVKNQEHDEDIKTAVNTAVFNQLIM